MAVTTQVPNGNGSTNQWSYTISSNWSDVTSDDGDSSYVYINSTSGTDRYTVPSLPAEAVSVNSCTVGAKFRNTLAGTAWGYVFNGNTNIYLIECAGAGSYQLGTTAHYSTSISAINAAQIGIYSDQTGTTNMRCPYVYRYTDYVVGGGRFMLFFLPILMALGVGLAAQDIPKMSDLMWRRHAKRLTPAEYPLAYRELKAHTFPHYVDLASR